MLGNEGENSGKGDRFRRRAVDFQSLVELLEVLLFEVDDKVLL